jgi:cell division protein FtsW
MSAVAPSFARSNARSRSWNIDPVLLLTSAALLLFGLVMMTSASISIADRNLQDPFYYLERQLLGVGLGLTAALFAMSVPLVVWQRLSIPLLITAFALLILVLIPGIGHETNGSRRWLRLGLINFQPSELARLLMMLYLAAYVVRRQDELKENVRGFLKPLALLVAAAILLLLEPDFGAATVLLATGLGLLFVAGVKLRHFFVLALVAGIGMALLAVTSLYRVKRLTAFLDPWSDPYKTGFQLTQSLIAIGRGEVFGVGLGSSVQKLFYLPEAHTDFVFAVMAEELGLVGILVLIALLVAIVWRSLQIAQRAAEVGLPFQAYCAAGFAIWIGLQSFVNIGVNMGILPTKGLTLPLVSYGGSSILVTLGWLGLVMRVYHEASISGRLAVPRRERSE